MCNNLKYPFISTAVNWARHTVGTIVPIIFFSSWLGAPGVLIGREAGGVLFALISVGCVQWVLSRLGREDGEEAQQGKQEREDEA